MSVLALLITLSTIPDSFAFNDAASVRAVDQDGQTVLDFHTRIVWGHKITDWVEPKDGTCQVPWLDLGFQNFPDARVMLIVEADGYATAIRDLALKELDAGFEVVLQHGRLVQIELVSPKDHPLPESIEPQLFLPQHLINLWYQLREEDDIRVERLGYGNPLVDSKGNVFTYRIEEDVPAVSFAISDAGYLNGASLGPFPLESFDAGPLEVEVPTPASMKLRLDGLAGNGGPGFTAYSATLARVFPEKGGLLLRYPSVENIPVGTTINFSALPSGKYNVEVFVSPEQSATNAPGPFKEKHVVELKAGEKRELASRLIAYDPDIANGDHSLSVQVKGSDGTAIGGLPYELSYNDPHYSDFDFSCEGIVPESGVFVIDGLSPRRRYPAYTLAEHDSDQARSDAYPNFQLEIGDRRYRGGVVIEPDTPITELTVVLSPDKGDLAPDVSFVALDGDASHRLSDWHGQVVLLEFWAAWCGFCQEPMAHNVALHVKKGAAWAGKAAILPLSIDSSESFLRDHLQKKDWSSLPQYWVGEPEAGFQATAATAFGVLGTPTALLIDQTGTIRWRGHPDEIDIASEIDALLNE